MPELPRQWLLLCGAASGVLHVALYFTQRAIQRGPGSAWDFTFAAILAAYALATCGLFSLYGLVVIACRRRCLTTRRERRLAILIPVVFNVALLPTLPSLSIDIYSYLAHGYVQAALGQNPYIVGARAVAGTPFGRELGAYGWQPVHRVSPYGPILTYQERAVVTVTENVRFQIVLLKAITVLATLGSAAVIWMLLGRVRPDQRLLGTVVFLWNPMVTWELAGDGHNDAVMILFILIAIALIVREQHAAGIMSMCLAVMTKYVPLMLVPLLATYAWRTTRAPRRLLIQAALGATIAVAITVVLFLPLWAGFDTFRGVRLNGAPGSTGSTATMVLKALDRVAPQTDWQGVMWGIVFVALLSSVTWQARRVIDACSLLQSAAVLWLMYTLLISPAYWPWYATTAVALLALIPERPFFDVAFAVSLSARLAAPLVMVFVHGLISRQLFLGSMWIIGVGMPLLVLALHAGSLARGARFTVGREPNGWVHSEQTRNAG